MTDSTVTEEAPTHRRKCERSDCPKFLPQKCRSDKRYCCPTCAGTEWQRARRAAIRAVDETSFQGFTAALTKLGESWKKPVLGYTLQTGCPGRPELGKMTLPEGHRKTKRWHKPGGRFFYSAVPYFRASPLEYPRVPIRGLYTLQLIGEGGVQGPEQTVNLEHCYPAVRFFDKKQNHYDIKGRLVPKRAKRVKGQPVSELEAATSCSPAACQKGCTGVVEEGESKKAKQPPTPPQKASAKEPSPRGRG